MPDRLSTGHCLLGATDIGVTRRGRHLLAGVDIDVHAGELVALVGPNGAGKSTLLAVLAGDDTPTTGRVELDGRDLAKCSDRDRSRRRSVLTQRPEVGFPFTVEQVVRMGRAPWHRTPAAADDDASVNDAIDAVEIGHLRHRSVLTLSGGEAARVAVARVLAQTAQLLLLDEPTAALDIHHEELTLRVVRSRVDAGAGAVAVLHDLALAAAHADRVVVLADGRVAADGPPTVVLQPDLLTDVYRHPVDVIPDPRTGAPLVLVQR